MTVRLHPHAIDRMEERMASLEEIRSTVENGESFPAKFGRTGFRRNFPFDNQFRGKHYHTKQIEAYAVPEGVDWLVITVITCFF
jgi:hypothetical protein